MQVIERKTLYVMNLNDNQSKFFGRLRDIFFSIKQQKK